MSDSEKNPSETPEAPVIQKKKGSSARNLIAFWIFGVCNNFVYVIFLAAAGDILSKHKPTVISANGTSSDSEQIERCLPNIDDRECTPHSAGIVLLCNIFPAFIIKISYPIIAYRIPYGVRHTLVCLLSSAALIVVALADSVPIALAGVMVAAISNGMGESTFLALASHYSKHTISLWSSGTGFAGVLGAFVYAGLTDPLLLRLTPTQAMLWCLIIPAIFFLTYFILLEQAETVKKVSLLEPLSWIGFDSKSEGLDKTDDKKKKESPLFPKGKDGSRWTVIKSLLKYMIPLFLVYWAEYFVNQGLLELIVFDCSHALGVLSPKGQYRWYQFFYQIGVFISRSSIKLIELNMCWIAILPVIQLANMAFFLANAIHTFVPHFAIIAGVVLFEGLVGGAAYVNTYSQIHKTMDPTVREFALSLVTLGDTSGILIAAFSAIPVHNAICSIPHV